ncbi:GntR family transcriptional regulator [Ochrobactrum soli]|uniref:GntR family transcriptional regulator n=2 Tax=Ochrobactrum TaxID=528 RepID=A0ABD5K0L8_9HYPH|nr:MULTISPECIES: GntR family transcriptional regulator [Brucella]MCI0999971.1 GntR family transcriptional regulator [Ochrobactrum sp. C6C9]RRD24221.1 GntR family transcriptional regulator [Brucellaceae bacterium VT-16-1752]WHT41812.1 GntR family transcriptional regulator [Ochrobactrum sp. SSR]MDX4073521.1 GntR family transcriptional regulator [Brucella sp. NBRC 113783]RLL73481.1 GntR family transcriptional regulator [[Ochrobactrum] soli]
MNQRPQAPSPKAPNETIAARISRVLADRIIEGEIEPGTKLRQDHIAEEFQTSHVPVREAFRRLEAQGLAVSEPRRGVRVASFDIGEIREVAEMRAALEVLALRHAAAHITRATLDAAERATLDGDKSRDVRSWEDANRRFHRLILEPCRMPRLLAAIDDLHAASARFLFATWRSEWEARTDHDHRAILDALRKNDIDHAAAILARHVQWIGHRPVRTASGKMRDSFAIVG